MRHLRGDYHVTEFWADRDITFSLEQGELLGIIGTNGAGKSTLLKAIAGIMTPSTGTIESHGNISALLELASGFDGDLTVKENAYLRGAMLGYTRKFMDERYEEIIQFAELQKFEDYQFKQLSSGMRSRLAFSIACLVDPDVLILDEVLSVGDGAFREKSGNKMREILKKGITAILVSHSISQVRELCDKILWLDHGKQIAFGSDVTRLCDAYEEFLQTQQIPTSEAEIDKLANDFKIRKEKEVKEQTSELRKMMRTVPDDEAYRAAIGFLKEKHPETLRDIDKLRD
jgi:ABC-2 type transport system ATP-binding protein